MLRVYVPGTAAAVGVEVDEAGELPAGTVWIDMVEPTAAEEAFVERSLGLSVPTREEMVEIEPSSRLYQADGVVYVTANLVAGVGNGERPISTAVSFVVSPTHLVTVRYAEPKAFELFKAHAERSPGLCNDAVTVLVNLLDAIVDRLADIMEGVGAEMDLISKSTFRRRDNRQQRMTNLALQVLLSRVADAQDLTSKARDSAVSLVRLLSFLTFALKKDDSGTRDHLKSLTRDVMALTDHATYLGGNVTFLLDAALGLISIEQNAIIKIFSVAAVIFLPPTLVASIYGMNFTHMPELHWHYGYPLAIGLMVLSAVLPYRFFKARGWL